jgi:MoaA/NifB/PqqE/SkfB family radical SAM enzyme
MGLLNYGTMNIELTKWCNLECKHCYVVPEKCKKLLSVEEYGAFFEKYRKAGGVSVLLTGGEIFTRKDLISIVKRAYDAGLSVHLFTNGTLVSKSDINWIKEYVSFISISLDGRKEHHEDLRGVAGCYEKTMKTIEMLHKNQVQYMIQSTVTKCNINDMDWIIDIIREYNPVLVKLGFVCEVGSGEHADSYKLDQDMLGEFNKLAWHLCKAADNYHTRVVTNLISKAQFDVFYTSMENVLSPWMFPDGNIYICYAHSEKEKKYWKQSDAMLYPEALSGIEEKKELLINKILEKVETLEQFELLELVEKVQKTFVSG